MTENTDFAATAATDVMLQETTLAQEQPPNLFYPIFIGLALSTLTLNFLNLQYILPAIGLLFLWLGFRRLRQVNGWFKACWIVTILRTVAFLFILIVNATNGKHFTIYNDRQESRRRLPLWDCCSSGI